MKTKKKIIVGTYKFTRTKYGCSKQDCYGGTNSWDVEIEKQGLSGKKLRVILEEV